MTKPNTAPAIDADRTTDPNFPDYIWIWHTDASGAVYKKSWELASGAQSATQRESVDIVEAATVAELQALATNTLEGDVSLIGGVVYMHNGTDYQPTNHAWIFDAANPHTGITPTADQVDAAATGIDVVNNVTYRADSASLGGFVRINEESTVAPRADVRAAGATSTDLVDETGIRAAIETHRSEVTHLKEPSAATANKLHIGNATGTDYVLVDPAHPDGAPKGYFNPTTDTFDAAFLAATQTDFVAFDSSRGGDWYRVNADSDGTPAQQLFGNDLVNGQTINAMVANADPTNPAHWYVSPAQGNLPATGTHAELEAGTPTELRVWDPKTLNDGLLGSHGVELPEADVTLQTGRRYYGRVAGFVYTLSAPTGNEPKWLEIINTSEPTDNIVLGLASADGIRLPINGNVINAGAISSGFHHRYLWNTADSVWDLEVNRPLYLSLDNTNAGITLVRGASHNIYNGSNAPLTFKVPALVAQAVIIRYDILSVGPIVIEQQDITTDDQLQLNGTVNDSITIPIEHKGSLIRIEGNGTTGLWNFYIEEVNSWIPTKEINTVLSVEQGQNIKLYAGTEIQLNAVTGSENKAIRVVPEPSWDRMENISAIDGWTIVGNQPRSGAEELVILADNDEQTFRFYHSGIDIDLTVLDRGFAFDGRAGGVDEANYTAHLQATSSARIWATMDYRDLLVESDGAYTVTAGGVTYATAPNSNDGSWAGGALQIWTEDLTTLVHEFVWPTVLHDPVGGNLTPFTLAEMDQLLDLTAQTYKMRFITAGLASGTSAGNRVASSGLINVTLTSSIASVDAADSYDGTNDYVGVERKVMSITVPATNNSGDYVTLDGVTLEVGRTYNVRYDADRAAADSVTVLADDAATVAEIALMNYVGIISEGTEIPDLALGLENEAGFYHAIAPENTATEVLGGIYKVYLPAAASVPDPLTSAFWDSAAIEVVGAAKPISQKVMRLNGSGTKAYSPLFDLTNDQDSHYNLWTTDAEQAIALVMNPASIQWHDLTGNSIVTDDSAGNQRLFTMPAETRLMAKRSGNAVSITLSSIAAAPEVTPEGVTTQVDTWTSNNNELSEAYSGIRFEVGSTSRQIRMRNDTGNKLIVNVSLAQRNSTTTNDQMHNGGAATTGTQAFDEGEVLPLGLHDVVHNSGHPDPSQGDTEYIAATVHIIDNIDRQKFSKLMDFRIAVGVGNSFNGNIWRLERNLP